MSATAFPPVSSLKDALKVMLPAASRKAPGTLPRFRAKGAPFPCFPTAGGHRSQSSSTLRPGRRLAGLRLRLTQYSLLNESSSAQGDYFLGAAAQIPAAILAEPHARRDEIRTSRALLKISAILRFSRCSIGGQDSSNLQPMCSARTGPTLLLPAPIESDQNYGLHLRRSAGHIRPVNRHINPCDFGRLQDAVLADSVFFVICSRRVF